MAKEAEQYLNRVEQAGQMSEQVLWKFHQDYMSLFFNAVRRADNVAFLSFSPAFMAATISFLTLIFSDVVVRVSPSFSLAMHVDTDESNAAANWPGWDRSFLLVSVAPGPKSAARSASDTAGFAGGLKLAPVVVHSIISCISTAQRP